MTREVEPAKTARALRKLRKAIALAEAEGRDLSAWERDFAASLEDRLETFGSAFRDRAKGEAGEALSHLQAKKLGEIAKKAKTGASPWPGRKALRRSKRGEREAGEEGSPAADAPTAIERAAPEPARPTRPPGRPTLTVIAGGRGRRDDEA